MMMQVSGGFREGAQAFILDQTEARRAKKFFFQDCPPSSPTI